MRCNKARKLLQEYLEGTLESVKKKKLEEHIKGCISCKKELESLNEYFTTMGSIESINAPEEFLKSVRKRIEEAQKPRTIVPIRIKVPLELAGAVAAIVIAVIIFRNMLPGDLKTQRDLQTPPGIETPRARGAPRVPEVPREHEASRHPEAPQKSKTAKDESAAKEPGEENLVSSLKEVSGNEAGEASEEKPLLPAPAAEKQAPVKLVLLLPQERPEPSDSETLSDSGAPDEEIKMKKLSPDEEAPQRSAERDEESAAKISSSKEEQRKITETYDKEISAIKPSGYGHAAQKSVSEIEELAKRLGGTIVSMEYTKDGDLLHFITLSMPTAQINDFIDGLNAFGKIEGKASLEELKPLRGDTILISIELSIEE
jgi:hypothetical protein